MKKRTARLKRIVSIASATGTWIKVFQNEDEASPHEFWPVSFWLAGEFQWSDGLSEERVIPITHYDYDLIKTDSEDSESLTENFAVEIFLDSDFEVLGKSLRSEKN